MADVADRGCLTEKENEEEGRKQRGAVSDKGATAQNVEEAEEQHLLVDTPGSEANAKDVDLLISVSLSSNVRQRAPRRKRLFRPATVGCKQLLL